jgi:hypothetical protein
MTRQLGGVVGVAVMAAVFATVGSYGSPESFGTGFSRAIGVCGVLSFAGALAGLGIAGRRTVSGSEAAVAAAAQPVATGKG